MASPQTANGYARLANELLQAIYRFQFSGQELRVVIWTMRFSYGWSRKQTQSISVREMAKEIHIPPSTIGWVTKHLRERGVLVRLDAGGWRVNKNYEEWLERGMGQLDLTARTSAAQKPERARKHGGREPEGFKPPTVAQVQAYCLERKSPVDAEKFWHHYAAAGWMVGRNPMTNWKSAVCYWERTTYAKNGAAATAEPPKCPVCAGPTLKKGQKFCDECAHCRRCDRTDDLRLMPERGGKYTVRCTKHIT